MPFLGSENGVDDGREEGLDGVGVDTLDDGKSSSVGSSLDSRGLVTDSGEDRWQENDEVWLNVGGDLGVLGDGLDGVQATLTGSSILLVVELLGDGIDGPVEMLLVMYS